MLPIACWQGVPLWETKLEAGDLLLIPSGWWHQDADDCFCLRVGLCLLAFEHGCTCLAGREPGECVSVRTLFFEGASGSLAWPWKLAETLAIASGLITPRSGSWSAVAEVVRFHSKADEGPIPMCHMLPIMRNQVHPNWTWGRLPSPPTPNAKLTKEEATRIFRRWPAGLHPAHPDTRHYLHGGLSIPCQKVCSRQVAMAVSASCMC